VVETQLVAEARTEFGKGAARRTRRAGLVPAVMHSRGEMPIHVSLPGHGTYLALRQANAVLEIELDGKKSLTIAREIQRHPVTDVLEHVDLQVVRRGEKIEADVPMRIEGEPVAGIAILDMQELRVRAEALQVPDHIAVSVDGLTEGDVIRLADLVLPANVEALAEPEAVIVTVTVPRVIEEELPTEVEEEDEELAEAEGEEAPAEEE